MGGRGGGNGLVEDAEGADDAGICVGEERESDAAAGGKGGEDLWGVVADGGEVEAALLEFTEMDLQLHELSFAVGSPIGGAEEEQDEAFWALEGGEGAGLAGLIRESEGGDLVAGIGAGGGGKEGEGG